MRTPSGDLRGDTEGGVGVWRGVPYAEQPVGPRRFQAPGPLKPWSGIRDAREHGPLPPQTKSFVGGGRDDPKVRDEARLTLTVWSPDTTASLPVMVWIPGGAFVYGAGQFQLYNGSRLAANGNVVVVNLTYRIGVFGGFELGDLGEGFDDNLALRDQIAALRWVRDNIAAFGGDPQRVTVFGESAGGTSVLALLASPAARGLVHRAIAQSPALPLIADRELRAQRAQAFMTHLGVPVDCVKELPQRRLRHAAIGGGTPRRLTFDGGREGSVSPDGKWLVYVRGFNSTYWDNYTGSANYDIYLVPMAGGTPKRLTKTDGNEHYPFFSKDGKTIYFVAEEGGVANFYAMPTEGGEARQVTSWEGLDVQRPDLSWDGKTVVFERGGKLCWTDLEKPGKEPTQIPLKVNSDVRNSGIETRTITEGGEHVSVSSDGTRLAFSLRGDIWIMASSGGEATRITEGPANDQWPKFSPDGSKIAYFSNAKDNNDLFVIDLSSRKVTQVTKHKSDDMFHNWSPDGKSLVFCSERSGNRDIWVIELETGTARQITKHQGGDDDPCFSPDGKLIAFDSGRAGTQAIYVCDVNGENIRRVTPGSGFLQVPCFSPDGQMLVYEAFQPGSNESGGLFVISVQGGPSMQISRDGQTACWSPRGDFIYFAAKRRAGEGVYRVRAPESVEAGERVPFIGKVTVELRKELAQLFDEAWNALGNGFYDTKMHGVDWKAMRKKYLLYKDFE